NGTGYHHLHGVVEVRRHNQVRLDRRTLAQGFDATFNSTEHRSHGSGALYAGLVHEFTAPPHEPNATLEREAASRVICSELPERMAGRSHNTFRQPVPKHRKQCGTVQEERRLRILREREITLRAVEQEAGHGNAKRLVTTH